MTGSDPTNVAIRSDTRIPKLRTRRRAIRQKLLTAAQGLIESQGERPKRFGEVFESAGVSRGLVYCPAYDRICRIPPIFYSICPKCCHLEALTPD